MNRSGHVGVSLACSVAWVATVHPEPRWWLPGAVDGREVDDRAEPEGQIADVDVTVPWDVVIPLLGDLKRR